MKNKYEMIGLVGEGAYGIVFKYRNKETGEYVAIKKFKETEDDLVRKTMRRELRMLQILKHPNIVEFKEAFKWKTNLYLVFEYVERNLLEVLQEKPTGLEHRLIKSFIYQLCLSIRYLHEQNIIHRDIKPENLLIDNNMQLKLCDFGFARKISMNSDESLTDYVATRWYRSPELLITNRSYGPEVDYWAIGCIMGELADGNALFPGENETDQLHCIQKILGNLPENQIDNFYNNPIYNGKNLLNMTKPETLERRYMGKLPKLAISFLKDLLALEPSKRLNSVTVFEHPYFANYLDNSKNKKQKNISHERDKFTSNLINANITSIKKNYKKKSNTNDKSIPKISDHLNNPTTINNTNLNIVNYNIFNDNSSSNNNISNISNAININDSPIIFQSKTQKNIFEINEPKHQNSSQIVPSPELPIQPKLSYSIIPLELTLSKFPKMLAANKNLSNPHSNKNKFINNKKQFTFTTRGSFIVKSEHDTSSSSTSILVKDNQKNESLNPNDFISGYKTFYNNKKDPYNFNINTQFKKYSLQQIQNTARFPNSIIDEEAEYNKHQKKHKSKSLNLVKKPNYNWQKLGMYRSENAKKNHINYANSSCYGASFSRGLNFNLPSLGKVYKANNNYKKYKY